MNTDISKIQEARAISSLIRCADEKGDVDFSNNDIGVALREVVPNGNVLDYYLYELNEGGLLHYEEIGEDGFAPIIMCSVTDRTHEYLSRLLWQINQEMESLNKRINDALTFNPAQLSREIQETEEKLSEVKNLISSNELLKPLEKQINLISSHFNSAKVVYESYEDIYKNIVRPVQEEGRQGVRATVRWAIISIVVSVLLSWVISNWNTIKTLLANT